MIDDIAIVVLTPGGLRLARKLQPALPGSTIHASKTLDGDVTYAGVTSHLAELFAAGTAIIGVCAAGILIRALAPVLNDKTSEPAVLALAEDGSAIVPLLGGHRGANSLARHIAEFLSIAPSITTAGDLRLGLALDEPPPGWRIADMAQIKPTVARLLAGAAARLDIDAGNARWLADKILVSKTGDVPICITDRADLTGNGLVYHPPILALGVGCARGVPPDAMIALAEHVLSQTGLAAASVAVVVSHEIKADEAAVHALAAHLGVPARFFGVQELLTETPRLSKRSEAAFQATGCWGVAEGAALAAAGAEGTLVVPKQIGGNVTIALARSPHDLNPASIGVPRGRLHIVGIGPGSGAWRTPAANAAIKASQHLVGYGLYLDLLGPLAIGKERHETGLGHEEDRARLALELAATGQTVSLICSGDAGIYALATLVFELIDRAGQAPEGHPEWRRVEISVEPGISALQAAASRAGAPLGHDFCAISLSDLLTPWPVIERRLEAAAEADFVVALYNPRSERRITQLARACEILAAHRPANTPVVLARNLGREGEQVWIVDLAEFDPEMVDMLTLVLIGSSETKRVAAGHWIYTPRGYANKRLAE